MTAQGHPRTSALSVPIWHQTGRKRDRREAGGRDTQIRKSFLPALFINFHKSCLRLALQALCYLQHVFMLHCHSGCSYIHLITITTCRASCWWRANLQGGLVVQCQSVTSSGSLSLFYDSSLHFGLSDSPSPQRSVLSRRHAIGQRCKFRCQN